MPVPDLEEAIAAFKSDLGSEQRYASFDYCYNYFRSTESAELVRNLERSCLTLGFYLASWGMMRGSSFLLQKSVRYLKDTVVYIGEVDRSLWEIDVDVYDDSNMEKIMATYKGVRETMIKKEEAELTLVTKILLGVFGFVPAFDNYFTSSFREMFKGRCGFRRVNLKSLNCIREFYESNKTTIDAISRQTYTLAFESGLHSQVNYPKAKIIDMYGFMKGLK